MKLQLDFEKKTIRIDKPTNVWVLMEYLKKYIPSWTEWILEPEEINPTIQEIIVPNENTKQWWQEQVAPLQPYYVSEPKTGDAPPNSPIITYCVGE